MDRPQMTFDLTVVFVACESRFLLGNSPWKCRQIGYKWGACSPSSSAQDTTQQTDNAPILGPVLAKGTKGPGLDTINYRVIRVECESQKVV